MPTGYILGLRSLRAHAMIVRSARLALPSSSPLDLKPLWEMIR
jgi:hypothetical protein